MTEPHLDPLQDAIERLHWQLVNLHPSLSAQLLAEAPDFLTAANAVAALGHSSHIPAPTLTEDERQPAEIFSSALFDHVWDDQPPRRLADVWEGRGDYDDPFEPANTTWDSPDHEKASAKYDDELLARRMRTDSDQSLDYPFRRV